MNKKKQILWFILFMFPIVLAFDVGQQRNIAVETTFVINVILFSSCLFLVSIPGVSLFKVFFTFQYVFFGVIPLVEFRTETVYWTSIPLSSEAYLIANVVLFFINIFYLFVYFYSRALTKYNGKGFFVDKIYCFLVNNNPVCDISFVRRVLILWFSVLSVLVMLYVNDFSLLSLLVRGGELKSAIEIEGWKSSIINAIFRYLPMVSFYYCFLTIKNNHLLKVLLFFCALICASPLGIARFLVATLYFPLVFIVFPKVLKGDNFTLLLFGSIFVVFPFLEQFRNFDTYSQLRFFSDFTFFLGGHFDSYQSFVRVIDIGFISYGYQLLGSMLFFVPRFIWPSKPIGTGAQFATDLNYEFTNISANYFAEGYANFGIVGCFIFSGALAFLCQLYDCAMYRSYKVNTYQLLFYFFIVGFFVMFLRGDLMTAISGISSIVVSFFILKRMYSLRGKL